ncbi:hypothetical protein H0B43_22675 [Rhodococcus wratislaviensis]|nr:hypothetical protein [Rhodococcus sp. 4CII]
MPARIARRSTGRLLEHLLTHSGDPAFTRSVDGFITDRVGGFGWTVLGDEQCRFHVAQIRELGGYLCGRELYGTMLLYERYRRPR